MAFCPNYGRGVSPEEVSCPNCGHPLVQTQPAMKSAVQISAWWWLVPFFLAWISGLVAYFVLRDRNEKTAEYLLIFGIVRAFVGAIVWFVLMVALAGFLFGSFWHSTSTSVTTVSTLPL